ncbi:MAG TPA: PilZ domain-containing protein [Gemmataceae bacterium]|nr:PilZ domain-containing protein [Gemmataceae bacterium]
MFEWVRRRRTVQPPTDAAAGAVPAAPDRRQSERVPVSATVVCRADRPHVPPTQVRVGDVSRTGLSLLIERPLKPGMLITLDVPTDGGSAAVLAVVRHCTNGPDGGWAVGCAFAAELGDGDLHGFGVERTATSPADQRRWDRVAPTSGRAVVRRFRTGPGAPAPARILNLSPNGIGLAFPVRVDPGTLLDLELIADPDRPGLVILASVVYVAPGGDGDWVLGCTFIRELSDTDLRALT